ncbi:hypothetical protein ILYODFUR_027792 [Ilyodon furcidens]|uniref:Secreted protein n=1 Tax=Ilyodon furcidens TaxID=33524 RepID=A0ABV0VHZ1_9TELE
MPVFVRLGLGLLPLLDQLRPPIKYVPYFLPTRLSAGVSARWCIGGSRCLGLGTLVWVGSLLVAACRGCWGCGSPGGGPPGVPVIWVAFGCLGVRSPRVQGGKSVAPHARYCIFLWRNLIYTSTLTLTPTGVWIQVLKDTHTGDGQ